MARCVLFLGFARGLRRSEIAGLDPVALRGKAGWREVEIGRGSSDATGGPAAPTALSSAPTPEETKR